ncbi:MAG: TetR/AcrR family transcriptional regulator, partial [Dehalococcoidales bacterium]
MNGFNRRSKTIQQKILSAATGLLASQGVKKTSINQISKKAEVSPVTIYNYFGSKAGLVKETIKYLATQKLEEAEKLFSGR